MMMTIGNQLQGFLYFWQHILLKIGTFYNTNYLYDEEGLKKSRMKIDISSEIKVHQINKKNQEFNLVVLEEELEVGEELSIFL